MTNAIGQLLDSPVVTSAATLVAVGLGALWLAAAWWTYLDMSRRSDSEVVRLGAVAWVLLSTPALLVLSLPVYLLVRPQQTVAQERSQLVGTVGIVRESAAALTVGLPYYLTLVGLVSMSLAQLNLLPLLPLDGGHIAVSIIESIRRRALAREVYERVSIIGLAIVLFVAFIALNHDISRPG